MRDISNASHLAKTQPSLCAEWSCPTLRGFIGFSLWVSVWGLHLACPWRGLCAWRLTGPSALSAKLSAGGSWQSDLEPFVLRIAASAPILLYP